MSTPDSKDSLIQYKIPKTNVTVINTFTKSLTHFLKCLFFIFTPLIL